jgi:hypothetical protein
MRARWRTALERQQPQHEICDWLGINEKVENRNYWSVIESDRKTTILSGALHPEKLRRVGAESDDAALYLSMKRLGLPEEKRKEPLIYSILSAEDTGFEPATPYGALHFQ